MSLAHVTASPDAVLASICRRSFERFVRRFWDAVPGAAPLRWNWHMSVLCDEMQAVCERIFAGVSRPYDVVTNVPPGTSKSSIVSILLPVWMWTRMPTARIICASHTSELVLDFAVKSRDVIRSELYRRLFPDIEIKEDTDMKGLYRNIQGGERHSCTIAGRSPTGRHAHLIVIDDPLDPKKALSEVEITQAKHFMEEVIPSRKVDKEVAVMVLVMQRLGVGDPSDVMLDASRRPEGAPVRHICLPAELTPDVSPPELAAHYQDGLLDKSRLPESVLKQERSRNAFTYATQYLQKPTLPGGGMFRPERFNRRVRCAPMDCRRIFYVDRAAAVTPGACFTAGVLLARSPQMEFYVEDVIHGRWEPDERNAVLRAACLKYRRRYGPKYEPKVWVEAEGGSSGRDAWKGVFRALAGFTVREDRVTGKKDTRAEGWASALAAGVVVLVDGGESDGNGRCEWDIEGFITEHVRFKMDLTMKRLGGYKDRVDACSGGYNLLAEFKSGNNPLRTYSLGMGMKNQGLRAVVCTRETLPALVTDRCAVLVVLGNPGEEVTLPQHSLARCPAWLPLPCADVDLSEVTDWQTPLPGTDTPPEWAALSRDQARKLWGFLLKKHDPAYDAVVFVGVDDTDRRPLSMAYGLLDTLRVRRSAGLIVLGEEGSGLTHDTATAPNRHCCDMVKAGRAGM